ncbi:MAG: hypothetical protein Sapg2KO_35890 [Saprospiraceae bacterium]
MSKNFFDEPFDDETLLKLEIYEKYLIKWIPVFIARSTLLTKKVNVFDFFAGAGQDPIGVNGSPLIAIKAFNSEKFLKLIEERNIQVTIYLNDYDKATIERLRQNVDSFNFNRDLIKVEIYQEDFQTLYDKIKYKMDDSANLVFLDQFGVRFVRERKFVELINRRFTDILFFISSSQFNRFYDNKGFKEILDISKEELMSKDFYHIHNLIVHKYNDFIPPGKEYYLAPFSIKERKSSSINGLIFGSGNELGIEKFLRVGWEIDPKTGEANFDIDKEKLDMYDNTLFAGMLKPKKLEEFEKNLEKLIKEKRRLSEKDIFYFSVKNGFLAFKHAEPVFKRLRQEGIVTYEGKLGLTYSTLFSNKTRMPKIIKLKKNGS